MMTFEHTRDEIERRLMKLRLKYPRLVGLEVAMTSEPAMTEGTAWLDDAAGALARARFAYALTMEEDEAMWYAECRCRLRASFMAIASHDL